MPPMGDHSGMPPMGDHSGMPPMGDHSGMPPMGSSLGMQCDSEPTPKKISKCLRNLLLEHKPELKPFGCGMKKNNWDQVARGNCLRDLLDGPA
jgi:hypothetical protein